jgi:SAM-dependent methyltransferase
MGALLVAPRSARGREPFRPDWGTDDAAAACRRWYAQLVLQARAARDALLDAAQVGPGMRALDLASGYGEPALALSEAVGSTGHVSATDPSPELLHLAEENAARRGISNISFQLAPSEELPYPDETLDLVTCSFGEMYFRDVDRALSEARRVLKPSGRAVFAAWGPFEQPYFTSTVAPFAMYLEVPAPPEDAPDHFRFSRAGSLSGALARSGFQQVWEEFRVVPWRWPGPPAEFWQAFLDLEPGFRALIESLPADQLAAATQEALAAVGRFYDGSQVRMTAILVLASGAK